ncbi:MAG: hypothetical protein ACRCS0_06310 [Albidovulum sp.]
MSNGIRITLAICALAFVAACAKKEEPVVVEQPPVTTEPEFTGKYK